MIAVLKMFLAALMSMLCTVSPALFGDFSAPYSPEKEDCKIQFAVISDIHMTDEAARCNMLKLGLYDMENAKTPLDALVISGDMTDHAETSQYENLTAAFSEYTPAKNIVMAVGNHDTWNSEVDENDGFPKSSELFIEYNKKIAGRDIDKVYYSTEINGYTFIVMSSEKDMVAAYISDEQLVWLDSELKKASEDGNPIFVVCHWPLNQTHGLPLTWLDNPIIEDKSDLSDDDGGLTAESDKVEAILNKYKNVFYITGHLHNGIAKNSVFGYSSVEKKGNINLVNLPCYMYSGIKGTLANGLGFNFEVYDDEVVIRARSFSAGVWYTKYSFNVPLD